MLKVKLVEPEGDRILLPLKAAALVALVAVGALIVVSVDASRATLVFDEPVANMAQVFLTADGPSPGRVFSVSAEATTRVEQHSAAVASK
jgi:hypothetical protein